MVHLSHQISRLNFSGDFSMPGIEEWISEKSTTMLGNLFEAIKQLHEKITCIDRTNSFPFIILIFALIFNQMVDQRVGVSL
jgi:hypothetical protein